MVRSFNCVPTKLSFFSVGETSNGIDFEGLSDKFHTFLSRATNSASVLSAPASAPVSSQCSSSSQRTSSSAHGRRVVLLEDLPNILHPPTQAAFQSSLYSAVVNQAYTPPVVIIISDAGVRGERDIDGFSSQTWKGKGRDVVDVRTVLPPSLLHSPYVTQISCVQLEESLCMYSERKNLDTHAYASRFNPIAPTLMRRALQNLIASHFSTASRKAKDKQPSKEIVDLIIEASNGDIRSAIISLQFACTTSPTAATSVSSDKGAKGKSKKNEKVGNSRALLEVISRREQNLVLFHFLGKILYNKRK